MPPLPVHPPIFISENILDFFHTEQYFSTEFVHNSIVCMRMKNILKEKYEIIKVKKGEKI